MSKSFCLSLFVSFTVCSGVKFCRATFISPRQDLLYGFDLNEVQSNAVKGHHVPVLGMGFGGCLSFFSKDNSTFVFVLCVCLGLTQKLKNLILVGHAGKYPNP